jgi:hypothetical protein
MSSFETLDMLVVDKFDTMFTPNPVITRNSISEPTDAEWSHVNSGFDEQTRSSV